MAGTSPSMRRRIYARGLIGNDECPSDAMMGRVEGSDALTAWNDIIPGRECVSPHSCGPARSPATKAPRKRPEPARLGCAHDDVRA